MGYPAATAMTTPEAGVIDTAQRCDWCGTDPQYVAYHDNVWGRPVSDDRDLFEKLCLDGQQAGLSWLTILRKQANYEAAFDGFDPEKIARYTPDVVERLMADPGIVRNRLKINAIIRNAQAFLTIQEAGDASFASQLWAFVDYRPVQSSWASIDQVPVHTPAAQAMSRMLKKQGFSFVGPTIVYAFMQAVGMVNDHLLTCPQRSVCVDLGARQTFPAT